MAMDMNDLAEALEDMASAGGVEVGLDAITKELKSLKKLIDKSKEKNKKLGLDVLMNKCLDAASKLIYRYLKDFCSWPKAFLRLRA